MTYRRAAPGPQLATGRLRVDAARAIAKLREYQLADRSAWILEAIRAAVASGAERIELAGDANDVWLRWDGPPWPADELPRLFDELVSPAPANERHHLRLLAAGVNSALGMDPAYVDVIAIGEAGAARARYTPDVLVEGDDALGDAPLRRISVEPISPSPGRSPGMEIHLRRRASLEVMAYLLSGPPELDVAAAACRDIAVPLTVAGKQLHRDIASRDVVRVPLGRDLDGFLAVTDAEASPDGATLEVAERGVVLVRYALALGLPKPRAAQPVRLFCDAPRMPTNAARSQVRHDCYPIDAAVLRVRELGPELVARLAAQVATERGRAAALALLAAHVVIVGHDWPAEVRRLDGPLRALAALPLLRDAVGEPHPLAWSWNGLVHRGDKPFGAELAPWLGGVAWIPPGDDAERLLMGWVDPTGVRRQVRWARQQSRAHRRFFAHRAAPPKLAPREQSLIHVPLGVAVPGSCVSDAMFAGMSGEVWIPADQHEPRGGELILLLEGRELERATFESPIAFTVIVDTKDVTPADRYRSAIRDGRYARVERAMRAGLVRAVERHVVDAGVAGPSPELTRLAQATLAVVDELHIRAGGPLASAAIWQTTDGARVALDELVRRGVVGIVPPGTRAHTPPRRLVVEVEGHGRAVLARHVEHLVPYERANVPSARDLAGHLLRARHHALAVGAVDTVGAVAVSDAPRLIVYHMGVELASRAFEPQLVGCTIAIDSPAVIPDVDWRGVIGDHIDSSLLLAWEIAFVRAAARAVAGDPPAELIGRAGDDPRDDRDIRGELGQALCTAVLAAEPDELLGAALLAQLRDGARVVMHGETFPRSIAELARLPGDRLPHVDDDGDAIPGFVAVVADAKTASAIARLAGKVAHNATAELGERRRAAAFAARLERHRQLPEIAVALPGGVGVAVNGATARGVVGLSSGELWIDVLVERRRFAQLHPGGERDLPLVAVVDVATGCCDTRFETLVDLARDAIIRDVESAVGALLAALVAEAPDRFAAAGPHRTLLARSLAATRTRRHVLDAPAVERALCTAAMFPTVQGGRVALEQLRQPLGIVQCAAYVDGWLDAGDDPASALDRPILRADAELGEIVRHLHDGPIADVTDDVRKLQAQRQIARGLVPAPRLIDVAAELARPLSAFGARGARLGHGAIGLCAGPAELLVHDRGVLRDRLPLDVMPPVQLAIDAPELARSGRPDAFDLSARFAALGLLDGPPHPLSSDAQALAAELVAAVVREVPALPAPIRREVARAYLAGRLPAQLLAGIPLFDTIDGRAITIAAIADQHARFGDVWAVPTATAERPLDDSRAVVVLGPGDLLLAHEHGHRFADGARELALDATARRNRARPVAERLVLPAGDGVLATADLNDGPRRGVVAVLAPEAASRRGLIAHRDGHPFDPVEDPGPWPTLAVVEDPRLEPDRTWSRPRSTPVWSELCGAVRVATGHALARLVIPPADALAVERIDPRTPEVASARTALVYGAVWLIGAPFVTATAVDVAAVAPISTPRWDGVGARLVAVVDDRSGLEPLIEQIVDAAHARLLRALVSHAAVDPDVLAAHVANGLATRKLLAIDARGVAFDCFAPEQLDAGALHALFAGTQPVATAILADDAEPGATTFIDDDGSLARVVRYHLGDRLGRTGSRAAAAAPARAVPPAAPQVVHPLSRLLQVLDDRLDAVGIRGFHWAIAMRDDPPVRLALERVVGSIELAGDNADLLAVAAACRDDSPWATAAVDAVTAHVVTVLNVALTEITDATEAHALGMLLADLAPASPRS